MKFFSGYGHYHAKEKQRLLAWFLGLDPAIKRKVIMRINFLAFFVLICMLNVSATTFAQSITATFRNAPLKQVLAEINKQSGYELIYNNKHFIGTHNVTVSIKDKSLVDALDMCFQGQPVSYVIIDKTIVLKPKPIGIKDKIISLFKKLNVTGKVVDENGKPLPGVNVRVKGTEIKTSTNEQGAFAIDVPYEGGTLQFSFVGFNAFEQKINNSSPLFITMKQQPAQLEEVGIVSTGYQNIPKERATGSFSHVNNELFNRQVSTDVISRLNGIAPSLLFDERTGTTKLNIRGRSTIFANDQPLIVVDNFPYDGDINSINPNDVENITILRDAAAASIWGVRAGNGVIVITTKKGKFNQTAMVSLNTNVTLGSKLNLFYTPQISTSDFVDLEQLLFSAGKYDGQLSDVQTMSPYSPVIDILARRRSGALSATDASTQIDALRNQDIRNDLKKYFYRNSVNQQYALNISGGGEKYNYYLSSGYDRNLAATVGNDYSRFSLNTNNTFRPMKELEVNINMVLTQTNTSFDNTIENIRMGTQNIYPYARLVDDQRNALSIVKDYRSSFVDQAVGNGYLNWSYRPLDELNYSDNNSNTLATRINSSLRFNILSGLSAELRYQYENQKYKNKQLQDINSYFTRDLINSFTSSDGPVLKRNVPLGGILSTQDQDLAAHNGRLQLNFQRHFGDHEVNAIAGFEARQTRLNGYGGKFYGYDPLTGSFANVNYSDAFVSYPKGSGLLIPGPSSITGTVDRFRSYFINASYTYLGKYTVSGSARRDESNLFGVNANQKGVPLWSIGAAWNLKKEAFFNLPFDVFKLRTSFGYNGNFDNTVTALTTARFNGNYVFTQQPYAVLTNPPNANLQWERIRILNTGLDFSTSGGRIDGTLDVYYKAGQDLLGYGPLNATTGFTNYKGNLASSKGGGVDVQINSINLKGQFVWNTNFLFSYVTDKVSSYQLQPDLASVFIDGSSQLGGVSTPIVGKPFFGIYSYKWAGLSSAKGDPQGYLNNAPSTDYANLLKLPVDSLIYSGRATPSVFGAIRNTFSCKNLSLSFNVSYKFGYYFRRPSINYNDLINSYQGHSDYGIRWQNSGDELKTNVPSLQYPNNTSRDLFYSRSEVLVEKGDHIRLQDIQVSYVVGDFLARSLSIKQIQLYAYLNNVGILWSANKHGIDPDYGRLVPAPRTVAFGIKANL